MNKLYYILAALVLVVVVYIGFFRIPIVSAPGSGVTTSSPSPTNPTMPPSTGSQITVEGTMACVPFKSTGGPQPELCQIGLKTAGGEYYALADLDQEEVISGKFGTGAKVKITGTLVANDASSADVVGTIKVKTIK